MRRQEERENKKTWQIVTKSQKSEVISRKRGGVREDVPGQTHKRNLRGRSIRMQPGFLTHIMFLNYRTLHTPNS